MTRLRPEAISAVVLGCLPVAYLLWNTWASTFQDSFQTWTYYLVPWLLGLATATWSRSGGRPLHQALGVGLMAVPLWDTLWGVTASFEPLVQGGFVLQPYSRYQLSGLYSYKFLADLGYLGVGFLLSASPTPRDVLRQTPTTLAAALRKAGLPMGWKGLEGEGGSLVAGLAIFPLLLLGTAWVNGALSGVQVLKQSDETSLFANMTVYHAVLISLAAGFGEELAYRGLLQGWLSRRISMVGAVVVQAIFFGFAHSGYGTWIHVLLPTLFGLTAGLVAWWFGLWASITLHVLVDVFAFGVEAGRNSDWVLPALNYGLLANFVFTLVVAAYGIAWLSRVIEARRIAPRL